MQILRKLVIVALFALAASGPALALSPSAFQVLFSGGWWLPGASVDMYFAQTKYYGCDISCVSVSRASTGYAQTASGTLVNFAANVPRITDQGFLIEEARTNILLQSNTFSSWGTVSGVSASQNVIGPDGATSAWTLTQTGATASNSRINQTNSAANDSNQFAYSVYIQKTGAPTTYPAINLQFTGGTPINTTLVLNTQTGSFVISSVGSGSVASVGSYWRVTFFVNNNSTGNTVALPAIYPAWNATGTTTFNTQNGGTVVVFGAQIEVTGATTFPTSYIPTTTGSATRAADVPQLIGPAAAAALAAKAAFFQTSGVAGGTSPRMFNASTDAVFYASSTQASTTDGTNTAVASFGSGTNAGVSKIAAAFDNSSMTGIANGGTKATQSTSAWATNIVGQTPYLGNRSAGDRALNGYMQRFSLSPSKGQFDLLTVP